MDTMKVTVLPDGTIKIDTDKVSHANHMSAESLLRNIAVAGGEKQERRHKAGVIGAAMHALAHMAGAAHRH